MCTSVAGHSSTIVLGILTCSVARHKLASEVGIHIAIWNFFSDNTYAGWEQLCREIDTDVFHNSAVRQCTWAGTPPSSHQRDINMLARQVVDWIVDRDAQHRVLWVTGQARNVPSAQNIVDACIDAQIPLMTFFIHDTVAAHAATRLIPTLAYQLCLLIPLVRGIVGRAVDRDLTVLVRAMAHQLQTLIGRPCGALATGENAPFSPHDCPIAIVVEGLDKLGACSAGRIIDCLVEGTQCVPLPLRLVLCSMWPRALQRVQTCRLIAEFPGGSTDPALSLSRSPG